jgi:hypothetical protein
VDEPKAPLSIKLKTLDLSEGRGFLDHRRRTLSSPMISSVSLANAFASSFPIGDLINASVTEHVPPPRRFLPQ